MQRKWSIGIGAFGGTVILMFIGVFGEKIFDLASDALQLDFTATPSGVTQQDDVYVITFLVKDDKTLILRLDADAFAELKEKLKARED